MEEHYIKDILLQIEFCIDKKEFINVESENIELKDLSSGTNWNSLKETICAYLNTNGGFILCGIREKDNKYIVTGFDKNNENQLIDLRTNSNIFLSFDDLPIKLFDKIHFSYLDFMNKSIAIIEVLPLSDGNKYAKYKGSYYERILTQDKKISEQKLELQREYRNDSIYYKTELAHIPDAIVSDLNLDKINTYIGLLNRDILKESLKADIEQAHPFLLNQYFMDGDKVTMLGMLVCGSDPFHFLSNKVEVDCYDDINIDDNVSRDKKNFRNDVISLMTETNGYVLRNIKIRRTIKDGGTGESEYPEVVIRESINNALAHRDYTIDKFVTITIAPDQYIEIKNPGTFKSKIKLESNNGINIKRLIPSIPESKNPKLASVLKVCDKIENQGRGMASLVNYCLKNMIDLPHYLLIDELISLRIPQGKLIDENIEDWLSGYEKYIISKLKDIPTDEHKAVLSYLYKSQLLNERGYHTILLSERDNHSNVIIELKNAELISLHDSSRIDAPVYIIDPILMKKDFREELFNLIGNNFIEYDAVTKAILNITYQYTIFNKKALKPSDMSSVIYRKLYGIKINPKEYESLARKIRSFCNKLTDSSLLNKRR